MANIRLHKTNERIENQEKVAGFLQSQEVIYENWDISKLPLHLQENYRLKEEEKEEI